MVSESYYQKDNLDLWTKGYESGFTLRLDEMTESEKTIDGFEIRDVKNIIADIEITAEQSENNNSQYLVDAMDQLIRNHGKELFELYLKSKREDQE